MRKPFLKKAVALLMALVFAASLTGCAALKPTPPAGAEKSFLWASGFMPLGPGAVRAVFYTFAALAPDSRLVLLQAYKVSLATLEAGDFRGGIQYLVDFLAKNIDNPTLRIPIEMGTAALLKAMPGPDKILDPVDKEILIDLLHDLMIDLGVLSAGQGYGPLKLKLP